MAKAATRRGLPILGVNIGTMGFMAELESSEMDKLSQIATGDYTIDHRMMLDVTVQRDRDIIFHDIALNDVVVTKGAVARIVHLNVKCDGVDAMECGGDGIIIATPTGSTAYSMSAGGPILDPCLNCICATPICPQTMNNRPVIFSGDATLEFRNISTRGNTAFVSIDGQESIMLHPTDTVRIFRSPYHTNLIRIKKGGFLSALRKKLS
jgi:NAD+ kinase